MYKIINYIFIVLMYLICAITAIYFCNFVHVACFCACLTKYYAIQVDFRACA